MMRIECCGAFGVPVYFDAGNFDLIAQSRGIRRFKCIVVGERFFTLHPREQLAILYHEAGHCTFDHVEKRLRALWMIFCPGRLSRLLHEQELEADRVARAAGLGVPLAHYLQRSKAPDGPLARLFHPSVHERVSRLI